MTNETTTSADPTEDHAGQDSDETVKTAGRGFLVITAGKVWFLITAAAVQLGLPIVFGQAELFGIFKIVTEAIGLLNMVVLTGTMQAVSKLVSEQPERANAVVTLALKLQCGIGLPIAALYALGAPQIAASFNDPTLVGLLRLSSLIILFYSFYAIFIGYLNGVKEFVKQALIDMTFATLKLIGILGLVVVGFGVVGAVAGFVSAAGIICVFAAIWTFRVMRGREPEQADDDDEPTDALKRLLGYLVLIMLYTFALNGLMRADLFVLKSVAADMPPQFAGADHLFKLMSDKFAGFYGAVLNIARIPYQGVIAVTFVVFPMISESTFADDLETTRSYIRTTFRYCILLIAGVAMLLAFNSDSLIAGLYSADYQAAATALAVLSVAIVFFALFYVATTMIIGSGHPLVAVVIMGVSLAISAVCNWLFVSDVHTEVMEKLSWTPPPSPATTDAPSAVAAAVASAEQSVAFGGPYLLEATTYMQAAAWATTIAMVTGCVASIAWLWWKFRATPPLATVARTLVAALALFAVDVVFVTPVEWVGDYGKLVFLGIVVGKMVVMGIVLLAVLALLREFGKEDVARVRAVIGR